MSELFLHKTATLDPTGRYRYLLTRSWNPDKGTALFVMLNPSTADAEQDDPTIRRCMGFVESLGFGELEVVNLFAFRATNPDELSHALDPIGPENDRFIRDAADERADKIIVACGSHGERFIRDRIETVCTLLGKHALYCLDFTNGNHPRHPLYCRSISTYPLWRAAIP